MGVSVPIQFKRAAAPGGALADGEPGWDTAAHVLYVGAGGTNYAINAAGYTDEQAQDAVGAILTDTATVDFTYNDAANTITADVVAGSIGPTQLASTAVTPGTYTLATVTVDAQGRLTAASSGSVSGYQPLDATLTSLAGLDPAGANNMIVSSTADAFTLLNLGANTFPARSSAGNVAAKTLTDFALTLLDDPDAATARATLGVGSGSGTVTSFSAGDLSPLFTTSEATVTTTPALTFSLNTQSANALFAGPTSGAATAPTFRAMVAADIPDGLITEAKQTLADNTTGNVSITRHGYAPKAPNDATKYLDGTGAYSVPPGGSLDINGLTATEPALDDALPEYDASAAANRKAQVDRLLGLNRREPGGRLTMASGDPTPASAIGGTLYYTPYLHDAVTLWDGTRWVLLRFPETSLALAVTNAVVYDVFAFLSSGALALETLAWTSTTARATAVTFQDGRLCKSGDKTRLYLGTLRASNTNACADQVTMRYLWNYYNQVPRLLRSVETTASWTYGTNSWRLANNAGSNAVSFVLGQDRPVRAHVLATADVASGAQYAPGIGLDRTTANDATLSSVSYNANATTVRDTPTADYENSPGIGFHTLNWIERAPSGTPTVYGLVTDYINSGIIGSLLG
jgi:hypothetical protein